MMRWTSPLLMAAVLLALWIPEPAAAKPCLPDRAVDVVARSVHGVVFEKRHKLYGCLRSVGTVRPLPHQSGFRGEDLIRVALEPTLAGRFVGYVLREESDSDEIAVVDLRTGRLKLRRPAVEAGFVNELHSFVLKMNGSVAWLGRGPAYSEISGKPYPGGDFELHRADSRGTALLARGPALGNLSLALDRRSIRWREAGQERSAPIR